MLKIKQNQWFDLNILGVFLLMTMLIFGLLIKVALVYLLIFNGFLIVFAIYLYKRIHSNKKYSIMVNSENLWFLYDKDKDITVELKDYWIQSERLFIWLKGSNKSISFMVSRRIIGAELFSQLRTRMI
jgi:hypothetical protein